MDRLNAMDAEFMRVIGSGMYTSPEILVKNADLKKIIAMKCSIGGTGRKINEKTSA